MKFCTECQSDVKNEDKSCDKCWSTLLLNKTDKIVKINITESNYNEFQQSCSYYLMSCITCKTSYHHYAGTYNFKLVHQCENCDTIHLINTDFEKYPYISNIPDELKKEFKVFYGHANDNIHRYILDLSEEYKNKYNSKDSLKHRFTLMYLDEYYKFLRLMMGREIHANILNSLHKTAINDLWEDHVKDTKNYEIVCEKICGRMIDYEPYVWMSVENRIMNHKKMIEIYENEYNNLPDVLMRFWKINYLRVSKFQENSYGQFFVKFQKTMTICYNPDMTIEDIQECIEDKTGISRCQQRLIFAGKQLETYKKLSYYNVGRDSLIHMTLRMSGC